MQRKTFSFDGKRYDIKAATPEELAVKVAMRMRDLEEGKRRISRDMTVKAWADEWFETYKAPTVGAKTQEVITGVLRVHILPQIGAMPLKSVKPTHCQRVLNNAAGRSKSLLSKIRYYMCSMFDTALDNALLISNPAAKLTLPKATDGTHRAITAQERELLLEVCKSHRAGLWAMVMLYCGLRPGETERVLGKHIDIKGKRLFVDGTKTKAAQRYVPLTDELLTLLAPYAAEPFKHVFTDANGNSLSKTSRNHMWRALRKAMHIAAGGRTDYGELQRVLPPLLIAPDFVPYCLRHTFCTDLQAAGVPINVAKELMGHSSIEMTANIYTHSSEESFEDARQKMNAHVG